MATLSANTPRDMVVGDRASHPMIASDIIYEGAAVGLVLASGHARPITSVDVFVGFAEAKADNASGAAADIDVRVISRGSAKLSVSGAVITDIGQPVYATDDDTFVFLPTSAVFIGFVRQFISAGVVEVAFDALGWKDPYLDLGSPLEYETLSDNATLDIQDNAKVFFVDTDAKTITLPAVATPVTAAIVNIGAYGTVAVNVSPNAADMIHAPDIAGTNDKDHINTKATAQRGDYIVLTSAGDANGPIITKQKGTWAQEA